jgi:uncharacterized protein YprB with RNaseH-like and TPR domain
MPDFSKALRQLRPKEPPQRQLFHSESPVSSLTRQLAYLKLHTPSRGEAFAPIEGAEEVTSQGRHLVLSTMYDADRYHGNVRLGRFSCDDLQRFMSLMKQKHSVASRESIVFLDTETTGIQGGTGMVPFLVGLGYFEGEDFRMVQYFMRDFDEEPSMLVAIGDLLRRFKLVVTYNGSSFDLPLLETRFTLARLSNPFTGIAHLDLLPGARRLWRQGHGSCRLAALESRIVSFLRGPDIPGGMIPRAYFDYLLGRGAAVMRAVLKHNVDDVVSLAALTICACDRTSREPAALDNPLDVYSLARVMENTSEWRNAIDLYEMSIRGGLPETILFKAQESLVILSRRSGNHARVLALCQELMRHSMFSMVGHEGAAIHYERIAGDAVRALEVVEQGLAHLGDVPETNRWRVSLCARRERLKQKMIQF